MKISTKILTGALVLAAPITAFAQEPASVTFDHEGSRYVYTVSTKGPLRIIEGVEAQTGKRFSLIVRGQRVRGKVGGAAVDFKLSDVQPLTKPTTLAAK